MFMRTTILPAILLFTFSHAVSQKAENLRMKGTKEEPEMIFVKGGSFMMGSNEVRGGSWNGSPNFCCNADRSYQYPGNREYDLGFRLVLVP